MDLFNFNTAYSHIRELYGIELNPDEFETIGLIAWEKIGNKLYSLTTATLPIVNSLVNLPCETNIIEAVYITSPDFQSTSNQENVPLIHNEYVEKYIEAWKWDESTLYEPGKLIKYREEGDEIVFDRDFPKVIILYHGIIADEDGLPLLNDKEVRALAAYVVYSDTYKQALMRKDGNLVQLAQVAKADWMKACTAARIPDMFTQNDMDAILDVKTRWDRKQYGKSYHPIL